MFTRLPLRTGIPRLPRGHASSPPQPEWLHALRRSVRTMNTAQRVALLAPLQHHWPAERCVVLFDALRGELDGPQWDELARALHALQPSAPPRAADEHAALAA